ncbi:hypothetical protein [Streptomyces sp. NPDC003720]|uniref:hypothetical protein n=1 Tax=Streptomyces sp. NPDC003720 TaxID=3364684 RepID=UPI0036CDA21B
MREHGEAVEADLRQHYGVRLRDLHLRDAHGHRRMTWRELRCYIRQLPSDARTRIATGDEDSIWGLQEHLTAVVIDELRAANWQRANEGAEKSKLSPRPKPFPRPGVGGGKKTADKNGPERQAARQRALRRAAERKQAIAAGLIR